MAVKYAVLPESGTHKLAPWREELITAVTDGGGVIVDPEDAQALVWIANNHQGLAEVLRDAPQIEWVQLPSAGVERWMDAIDDARLWTCAKGVYAEPVAEHALALALGGMRGISRYARATRWTDPYGVNLLGAKVCIVGGGEITTSLLRLLGPFGAEVTVVRNRVAAMDGADHVVGPDLLHDGLAGAQLVVLALALTPETTGIIDAAALRAMRRDAWLVNVARGQHIVTDDLVAALTREEIGGAALDVTDPEPLPEGHPLWSLPNVVITPHLANTPEMGFRLFTERITTNVARFGRGDEPLGLVDLGLGY
jgi:phosphoglycerate dehydrogenase-like enzyme